MIQVNPVSILSYGVVGLGFLLALLSFWLLKDRRDLDLRRERAAYIFMGFSILIISIGLFSEIRRSECQDVNLVQTKIKQIRVDLGEMRKNINDCSGYAWAASTNTRDNDTCVVRGVQAMNFGKTALEQCGRIDAALSAIER